MQMTDYTAVKYVTSMGAIVMAAWFYELRNKLPPPVARQSATRGDARTRASAPRGGGEEKAFFAKRNASSQRKVKLRNELQPDGAPGLREGSGKAFGRLNEDAEGLRDHDLSRR
jgi:hypothetical protein